MKPRVKYLLCVVATTVFFAIGLLVMTTMRDQRALVTIVGPPLVLSMLLQQVVHAHSMAAALSVFVIVCGTYATALLLPMLYFFQKPSRRFLLLGQAALIVIHILLGYAGMMWIQAGIG